MDLSAFHPSVRNWFESRFESETPVQAEAWKHIGAGGNVLIAAPTGSGKTFAAFLCAINQLVEESRRGALEDRVRVVYVSPLKALSNDIEKNLREPLAGIEQWLAKNGERSSGIRAMVRTGDTPPGDREKMRRRPPQILVTTPESLYLLLTSDSGRNMLGGADTVIVDEIHSVAGSKRGSHLSLSLARLDGLTREKDGVVARRIGLSATQKPIEEIAAFLTGGQSCDIVDTGHQRDRDIAIELPESPLSPVLSAEVWEEIYDRLEELIEGHRTTLVFVNTRRLCERLAKHLAERLGADAVTAHHGSLARDHRLEAEQALKAGRLRALIATASLELGIDIGHVDLVCQIGSPGSVSAFIQRVGRAGHAVGETPKGRLFPVSRDDLVECVALVSAVNRGLLDAVRMPSAPLDVLAQQLVAEVSARDWETEALFSLVRQAWPYRELEREDFDAVVEMLASGFATRRGRRAAYVHHDAVNGRLRARASARLTALQNGGAIPDHFDQDVILMPQGFRVGTVNEDFAFESIPGDIFQLGNTSYRILKTETGRVLVEDAHGQPPTIPFWFGDAAGRSDELSGVVSELREQVSRAVEADDPGAAVKKLEGDGAGRAAAAVVEYLAAGHAALGCLPTRDRIVLERFFDDTGDMHLVVHAPLGSRIMRAWGLSLRKRFCRQFNFELQASALEDSLILSLGETHSFETADVPAYLKPASVQNVLIQALLDAPLFEVRWRWNATTALAVQRMRNGQRLPPQWQRNQAEDLVAVVFPDQLACLENIRGEREIPDHPLVRQTLEDCLHEAMDIDGLVELLERIGRDEVEIHCVDLNAPSPLAAEIINARPYAFLDDGEAEERRTRAISQLPDDLASAGSLRTLSVEAKDQVRTESWIRPRGPDELHDGLLQLGFLTAEEFSSGTAATGAVSDASGWPAWFRSLAGELRASAVTSQGRTWWVATERLAEFLALHPGATAEPDPSRVFFCRPVEFETALVEMLRGRLAGLGPVSERVLCEDFALSHARVEAGLLALQAEGYAMRMAGENGEGGTWCERRLLARIHRYSRERRRRAVKPSTPAEFMRFLLQWHGFNASEGELEQALEQLEGWPAPVAAWEHSLLARRCADYAPHRLDEQFLSGYLTWFRPASTGQGVQNLVAATPITMVPRAHLDAWRIFSAATANGMGSTAQRIAALIERKGALFAADIAGETGLLASGLEQGIAELVARGKITADAFSPLRWLIRPETEKRKHERRQLRRSGYRPRGAATALLGRWSLTETGQGGDEETLFRDQARLATVCNALLRRYGVVFRAVIQRESLAPPWRYLLRYLRRMEDRGEVLGGRFVDGFSGEQFALPEAAGLLRNMSREAAAGRTAVVSAVDPLNLGGIITPGVKTAARSGNSVLLVDGVPAARMQGDTLELLDSGARIGSAEAERLLRTG